MLQRLDDLADALGACALGAQAGVLIATEELGQAVLVERAIGEARVLVQEPGEGIGDEMLIGAEVVAGGILAQRGGVGAAVAFVEVAREAAELFLAGGGIEVEALLLTVPSSRTRTRRVAASWRASSSKCLRRVRGPRGGVMTAALWRAMAMTEAVSRTH